MTHGSIYVDPHTLQPAICIDFLESRPDAADRMHWRPTMEAGEPGTVRSTPICLPTRSAG